MIRVSRAAGLALLLCCALVRSEEPRTPAREPAPARIILRTIAGDLGLLLDPTIAPRHAEQLSKLARTGVYDTTHFYRVDPTFLIQVSSARDRQLPLTPAQLAAIRPLSLELSSTRHVRGALTMAREDDNPDSAETSFSILLADAPHLDGKYTVFGRLEYGWDVIDSLLAVPRDLAHRPVVRLGIRRAEALEASVVLEPGSLEPARPVAVPESARASVEAPEPGPLSRAMAAGILTMSALALAGFCLSARLPARALGALFLMIVLVGAFLSIALLTPEARTRPAVGGTLFIALLATIRLMGRLEPPG